MRTCIRIALFVGMSTLPLMTTVGQITISDVDVNRVFTPGNAIVNRNDTLATSMNIGAPGTNFWDFSGLATHGGSVYNCVAVAGTPWVANFPGATHAVRVDTSAQGVNISVYQYLQLNSTSLRSLGNMGRAFPLPFVTVEVRTTITPVETVSVFPTILSRAWHAGFTSNTLITLNGSVLSNETTTSNATYTVDGYGTMRLPGSSQSIYALRVRTLDFTNLGPIVSFVFISRGGAQVSCEATDTSARSGTISVRRGSVIWNTSVTADSTTDVRANESTPAEFALLQNYPNPFNPSTRIDYKVQSREFVALGIFDVLGRKVATLVDEMKDAGEYTTEWNAQGMPSGVYFCRMQAGSFSRTQKLVFSK